MREYEIKLGDLHRILFGDVPYHFYMEVILRISVVYLLLMVSMRLMGKRMSSQLSRNEMAAVASLAAAIGVPLMSPERGLLPAIVIAAVIITYQMVIARRAAVDRKFESITQDKFDIIVKDGVLNVKTMVATRISRARVFAQLRSQGISHLGLVSRLYFEAGGFFSFVNNPDPQPGLSVLPEWDTQFSDEVHAITDVMVCNYCGNRKAEHTNDENVRCENCNKDEWTGAVRLVEV
ncbi:DUF421 domain-containing protein [Pedobacter endophyticus]|uniref:DUF421 domain-containing protein n=1 Tax=Pedobacter endophyticus TaxID=2789740 RepID=A0A7S9L0F3_9SPHI|nr:YetF domain-containing protein [Pedobacter endophyticus]QPH40180.1 DUF421 domain-containing protein [Pedobacter endophyticus]